MDYAFHIPSQYKQKPDGDQKIEKWIFRKAFESFLPQEVTWRLKQEFSQGSGSADILPSYFEEMIDDEGDDWTVRSGHIRFHDVSFGYDDETAILKNINLEINAEGNFFTFC